jgi:hypothetical protein
MLRHITPTEIRHFAELAQRHYEETEKRCNDLKNETQSGDMDFDYILECSDIADKEPNGVILKQELESLSNDALCELAAVMRIGSGNFELDEFESLIENAKNHLGPNRAIRIMDKCMVLKRYLLNGLHRLELT